MNIPLARPFVGDEELEQVRSVLASGWLSGGPKIKEFENVFSQYLGARHAITTTSCTTALSLALEACQIKRGTEIIIPDFTFPATGNVVFTHGCTPVIVDVGLGDYSIEPKAVERAISKKTSAIIIVHPFGHPAPIDEINEIAEKHAIEVIEDAATALGSRFRGKLVGSRGRAVCYSFHPRKFLTTGEGGCLVTSDSEVADRALAFRNHGAINDKGRYRFAYIGYNWRMSDVQAAIGIAQLSKLDAMIGKRREQAKTYGELLGQSDSEFHLPQEAEWAFHTYQSYVVRLDGRLKKRRDEIKLLMKERFGIETQIGTYSLHMEPSFSTAEHSGALRNGEVLKRTTLTLPAYHAMDAKDQRYVVQSLERAAS